MKKIRFFCSTAFLFFTSFFVSAAVAKQAELHFRAASHERIQLIMNGRLINRLPAEEIYIKEHPGLHKVVLRVFNRRGRLKFEHFEQLHIRPHTKNGFMLEAHPYKGSRLLRKVYAAKPGRPVLRKHKAANHYRSPLATISDEEFFSLKDVLSLQSTDKARLQVAKKSLQQRQLYAKDVEELLHIFRFEGSRLEFAKWAFDRVKDPENYEEVYGAFRYETTIIQLENYLRQKH
jgi:hypothetical protein